MPTSKFDIESWNKQLLMINNSKVKSPNTTIKNVAVANFKLGTLFFFHGAGINFKIKFDMTCSTKY